MESFVRCDRNVELDSLLNADLVDPVEVLSV